MWVVGASSPIPTACPPVLLPRPISGTCLRFFRNTIVACFSTIGNHAAEARHCCGKNSTSRKNLLSRQVQSLTGWLMWYINHPLPFPKSLRNPAAVSSSSSLRTYHGTLFFYSSCGAFAGGYIRDARVKLNLASGPKNRQRDETERAHQGTEEDRSCTRPTRGYHQRQQPQRPSRYEPRRASARFLPHASRVPPPPAQQNRQQNTEIKKQTKGIGRGGVLLFETSARCFEERTT